VEALEELVELVGRLDAGRGAGVGGQLGLELVVGHGPVGPRVATPTAEDRRDLPTRDQADETVQRSAPVRVPAPQGLSVLAEQMQKHVLAEIADLLPRIPALDRGPAHEREADLGLDHRQQTLNQRAHGLSVAVERSRDGLGAHRSLLADHPQGRGMITRYAVPVRLELHCHSTCSDGSLSPEALAREVAAFGVELFCLTDHDSTAGCARTKAALPDARVLRGLELSCKHGSRTVHLLMWGVSEGPGFDALQARLSTVLSQRRERIVAICARLATLGISLDAEAILRESAHSTPGRPDVARALHRGGFVTSMREAFDRYLHDDGPANVPMTGLSLGEGLALGRACDARMSLAHPHTQRHFALVEALFTEFRDAGLEGIEAYYASPSPARAEPWLRLARKLDLVVTAGSDFHGEATRVPRPGIVLPEQHADRLRSWFDGAREIEDSGPPPALQAS